MSARSVSPSSSLGSDTTGELLEGADLEGPFSSSSSSSSSAPLLPPSRQGKALAAFIAKLYSMLEDGKMQHLIQWSNHGGFVVFNADEFAREVLPQYFKHNNFASFVRQLNMYGFHKVNDFVQQQQQQQQPPSPLLPGSPEQHWEFSHPSFQKGKRDLLFEIKRKVPSKPSSKARQDQQQQQQQGEQVDDISERVERLEGELSRLQQSSLSLSNEMSVCKQLIREQRLTINQIIQYLSSQDSSEESQKKRKLELEGGFVRIDKDREQVS